MRHSSALPIAAITSPMISPSAAHAHPEAERLKHRTAVLLLPYEGNGAIDCQRG